MEIGGSEALLEEWLKYCRYLTGSGIGSPASSATHFFLVRNRPRSLSPYGRGSQLLSLKESELLRLMWREKAIRADMTPCAKRGRSQQLQWRYTARRRFDARSGVRWTFDSLGLTMDGRAVVDLAGWPYMLICLEAAALPYVLPAIQADQQRVYTCWDTLLRWTLHCEGEGSYVLLAH